jgi:hypothetical protein
MSLESAIADLHKAHSQGREKYTYFLLAAAGAAIGFAVQKTEGLPLSWWLLPVGVAIIFWGGSFYYGCKALDRVSAATSANFNLLRLLQGSHPKQPHEPQLASNARRDVEAALQKNIEDAQTYAVRQFRLLVTGAVLFVLWRGAEMVRITPW